MHGRKSKNIQYLMEKPELKRPLIRFELKLEDIIKRDRRELGLDSVGWIHLAQDRDQWETLRNKVSFSFRKILVNSSVVERLLGSREGFRSVESVNQHMAGVIEPADFMKTRVLTILNKC
jgi:hypothetical protein